MPPKQGRGASKRGASRRPRGGAPKRASTPGNPGSSNDQSQIEKDIITGLSTININEPGQSKPVVRRSVRIEEQVKILGAELKKKDAAIAELHQENVKKDKVIAEKDQSANKLFASATVEKVVTRGPKGYRYGSIVLKTFELAAWTLHEPDMNRRARSLATFCVAWASFLRANSDIGNTYCSLPFGKYLLWPAFDIARALTDCRGIDLPNYGTSLGVSVAAIQLDQREADYADSVFTALMKTIMSFKFNNRSAGETQFRSKLWFPLFDISILRNLSNIAASAQEYRMKNLNEGYAVVHLTDYAVHLSEDCGGIPVFLVESAADNVSALDDHKDFQKLVFQMAAALLHTIGVLRDSGTVILEQLRVYGCFTASAQARFVVMFPVIGASGGELEINLILETAENHWQIDLGAEAEECRGQCNKYCTDSYRVHSGDLSRLAPPSANSIAFDQLELEDYRPDLSAEQQEDARIKEGQRRRPINRRVVSKRRGDNDAQNRVFHFDSLLANQCSRIFAIGEEIKNYIEWLHPKIKAGKGKPLDLSHIKFHPQSRPRHSSDQTPFTSQGNHTINQSSTPPADSSAYSSGGNGDPHTPTRSIHQAIDSVADQFIGANSCYVWERWSNGKFILKLRQCRSGFESVLIMKPMRRKSREIEMLSDLKHANIVRLFNSQIHSDFVVLHEEYLTMPYWIRSDPGQTFSFTCAFMLDGIAALRELAKHRIIHRDISPSNVRWSRLANTWKLTDFDMAVFADENGVYRSDRVVGTEGFIAPEVLEGEPYSYSSDFCSLGKVALEEIFRPGTVRFGHEANRKIHQIIHLQLLRTDASPMNRKDPEFVEHALLEIYGVLIVVYRKLGLKWVKNKYDDLAALIAFKVYEEIAVEEQETHEDTAYESLISHINDENVTDEKSNLDC